MFNDALKKDRYIINIFKKLILVNIENILLIFEFRRNFRKLLNFI